MQQAFALRIAFEIFKTWTKQIHFAFSSSRKVCCGKHRKTFGLILLFLCQKMQFNTTRPAYYNSANKICFSFLNSKYDEFKWGLHLILQKLLEAFIASFESWNGSILYMLLNFYTLICLKTTQLSEWEQKVSLKVVFGEWNKK